MLENGGLRDRAKLENGGLNGGLNREAYYTGHHRSTLRASPILETGYIYINGYCPDSSVETL